jgi:hypothetical protein
MNRIKLSTLSMFVSLVFAGNVFAGDASSTAGAGASAGANAGSTAVGIGQAAPNINVTEIGGTVIPADTHTTVSGTQTLKNVPNVYAPALTTTLTETCMGSSSGGFSIAGFGISGGGTWVDAECVNRLNARDVKALPVPGAALAAKEVLCANAVVRAAFRKTGNPCVDDVSPRKVSAADQPAGNQSVAMLSQQAPETSGSGEPAVKRTVVNGVEWNFTNGAWTASK